LEQSFQGFQIGDLVQNGPPVLDLDSYHSPSLQCEFYSDSATYADLDEIMTSELQKL
jgi:hypothetical protein